MATILTLSCRSLSPSTTPIPAFPGLVSGLSYLLFAPETNGAFHRPSWLMNQQASSFFSVPLFLFFLASLPNNPALAKERRTKLTSRRTI
ncbi:hypothetical protein B0J18DRAFT_258446 [Chaetomium sp. MPI-SDFR-AT-0129]|nr:hypothetical protein B0J18DRAFT_258446 [Chaetomium sp. MPI-SDFR-AT-0129]